LTVASFIIVIRTLTSLRLQLATRPTTTASGTTVKKRLSRVESCAQAQKR